MLQKTSTLVFLISAMLATGMSITLRSVVAPLRNVPLVLMVLALNFIAAPALAWLLAYLLQMHPGHAAGLMLLGCAAGAPFLPKLVEVARGDLAFAAALMILLTAGTLIFMPLALPVLVPSLPTDAWQIAQPLLLLIVAPMLVGMFIRSRSAPFAARCAPILSKVGNLALLVLFALLVVGNVSALLGVIGSRAIVAAVIHFFGLFALSWWLAGKHGTDRSVVALATGARNFGSALVPASAATANPEIMIMLIVSVVVLAFIAFPTAQWAKRKTVAEGS